MTFTFKFTPYETTQKNLYFETSIAETLLPSPVKSAVHAAGRLPHCWQRVEHLVPTVPVRRAESSEQTPPKLPFRLISSP